MNVDCFGLFEKPSLPCASCNVRALCARVKNEFVLKARLIRVLDKVQEIDLLLKGA